MDVPKQCMSGNAAQTLEKRKLPVSVSPTAGAAAFQAWLEEEEEEWMIGQKLAATCPAEFICPISLDMMTEPVILAETGMTYERSAIRKWFFMGGDTCPLTGVRLNTTKVMAHKHLQRRIEKWVRARGMPSDEDTKADSLKAAMQSSFDEPDLAPPSLSGYEGDGVHLPGSPGASTTAPSTIGASTIGPSSIHKLSKPGKARSEGSSSRGGSHSRRANAAAAAAAGESNVKRSSILLRALSSSTLALLTTASSQNATPRSKCEPVCEGKTACEMDTPEEPLLRAPPNSPAVLPRGQGAAVGQHKRTVSQEELPRAAPGSHISVDNPVYNHLGSDCAHGLSGSPSGPAKAAAPAFSPRIHATCSAGCESVELVEGPVVEELQSEKVSLPLEDGGVVLGEGVTVATPAAAPDGDTAHDGSVAAGTLALGSEPKKKGKTARDGSGAADTQALGSKPKKGKGKKRRHKAEWVSVMEAPPAGDRPPIGANPFEGISRCTSTTSFYTTAEPNGCQETEGRTDYSVPPEVASAAGTQIPPAEGANGARSGLLSSLSRSLSRRLALRAGREAEHEPTAGRPRALSGTRSNGFKRDSYVLSRMSETGTAATSGAVCARAPAERPGWAGALLSPASVPGLAALALPTYRSLAYYRLFWSRCFGCMSAPDVLSLDIPEDAGLRMQSVMDADAYFHSEDAEVVSVHQFARRIIADYMPPVTAGLP